jgi:hypothetical protein
MLSDSNPSISYVYWAPVSILQTTTPLWVRWWATSGKATPAKISYSICDRLLIFTLCIRRMGPLCEFYEYSALHQHSFFLCAYRCRSSARGTEHRLTCPKVQRPLPMQYLRQGRQITSSVHVALAYCDQRKFTCIYSDRDPTSPDGRPSAKRRAIDESGNDSPPPNDHSTSHTPSNGQAHPSSLSPRRHSSTAQRPPEGNLNSLGVKLETPLKSPAARPSIELTGGAVQLPISNTNGEHRHVGQSRATTANSGPDEEAVIYSQSRMLQDPTGRVLYIGDSATLSFLQLLRMMVETVAGSSPFTNGT